MKIGPSGYTVAFMMTIASSFRASPAEQCHIQWAAGDGLPGASGCVHASLTWDPDDSGPESEILVVAGSFGAVGDKTAHGIAAWDGVEWVPLNPEDPDSTGSLSGIVSALTIYNNEIIAGGWFSIQGRDG